MSPLPRPAVRALEVAVWAIGLFLLVPALMPLRQDAPALGWLLVWGAALAEGSVGLSLVALALREAVPGAGLTRGRAAAALAAGALTQTVIGLLSWSREPTLTAAMAARHPATTCLAVENLLALPGLAFTAWLVARAFPVRPRWAGVLAGMGTGLVADGVWHLICPRSDPAHVLAGHGAATALMTATGWLLGWLWEYRQAVGVAPTTARR